MSLQMKYFVLKPEGNTPYDRASRKAMRAYAREIYTTNKELAIQLNEWVDSLTPNHLGDQNGS